MTKIQTSRSLFIWLVLPAVLGCGALAAQAAAPSVFMAGDGSTISVFNTTALGETTAVALPGLARSAVFSLDGTKAYVTAGKIFIIDAVTHKIMGKLQSQAARIVRISQDGKRLFAVNSDKSVWVYDLATKAIVAKIAFSVTDAIDYEPTDLAVSPDGSTIVLSTIESNCGEFGCPPGDPYALVTEINGTTYQVLRRIQPSNALAVAFSPDSQTIYVSTGSAIQEYAASSGAAGGSIAASANVLVVDDHAGILYAGAASGSTGIATAITISSGQIAGQASTTYPVVAMALTPDGAKLFAGGCGRNSNNQPFPCSAAVIATATMQAGASVTLAGFPGSLAVSPNGGELWSINSTAAQVTVVNSGTNKVTGGAEAYFSPYSLAVTPDGSKVYASSDVSGSISVINGHTLARQSVLTLATSFPVVGENAVSPDGTRAYMILSGIRAIDTSTDQIVGTIADEPQSVAVSADSKTLFALDFGGSQWSVNAYSVATLQKLYGGQIGSEIFSRLLISPANNLFAIADTAILFVSSNPIQVTKTIGQGCLDATLSPNGALLYCLAPATSAGAIVSVLVYNTTSGAMTASYSTGSFAPAGSVAITPDGASLFISLAAAGSAGGKLEKMDTANGAVALSDTGLTGQLAIQ